MRFAALITISWLATLVLCAAHANGNGATGASREIVVTFVDTNAGRLQFAESPGRVYQARARDIVSPAVRKKVRAVAGSMGMQVVSQWPFRVLGIHSVVYRLPDDKTIDDMLAALRADTIVESAQPLNTFHALLSGYDDPYWRLQQGVRELGLIEAHRFSSGRDVRVAVIDTGADLGHPELHDRIFSWRNFVGDEEDDFNGDRHGTAVAGVIASNANNGEGIIGVAPEAKLQVLKACWHTDDHEGAVCNSFTLAKAIAYAMDSGVQVVNMSLTGPDDPLLSRLLHSAFDSGITVVAAAGSGDDPGFPANLDTVIGVSTPARVPVTQLVDLQYRLVLAPGDDIITPIPDGGYGFLSGSSLAAAHVSGVIALLLEMAPGLGPDDVDQLLRGPSAKRASMAPLPDVLHACTSIARVSPEISCRRPMLPNDF